MKSKKLVNKKVVTTFFCSILSLLSLSGILSHVNVEKKEESIKKSKVIRVDMVKTYSKKSLLTDRILSYDEMSVEDLINEINSGRYKLEYSAFYNASPNALSKNKGAIYYGAHKETYYSERVLPGTSLDIPGRHVADDGTVRDSDGYIAVAANTAYLSRGAIVKTSMGPAKVYDSGCSYGVIDIYTNW